jgi:hypothetical protein
MKSSLQLAVFCAISLLWASQLAFSAEKQTPKTKPLAQLFDHGRHLESFQNSNLTCLTCHPMQRNTDKSLPEESFQAELAAQAQRQGRQSCHSCHASFVKSSRATKAANQIIEAPGATARCATCHLTVDKPESHQRAFFGKNHGLEAQFQTDSCMNCHKKRDCSDCHQSKENLIRDVHRRNFRFTHSIEAKMKPDTCVLCHQPRECVRCHQER